MTTPKIDRKTFLSSTVAAYATLALGGCSGESETGGTDDTGGTATGGTATGGTATGGTAAGGSATGGTATGGSATGGTATGGMSGGGMGGMSSGGTSGDGGTGGGTYVCTSETSNGSHSHPLTVPGGDVDRGYQDAPYVLQDGGTGHTHTVELEVYEFVYLKAGVPITAVSSEVQGHTHECVVTCTPPG